MKNDDVCSPLKLRTRVSYNVLRRGELKKVVIRCDFVGDNVERLPSDGVLPGSRC